MGRPLFSASRQPAVRVDPDPHHPPLEKWSYWNPFDPDSDEFFESESAIYEAFVDPDDHIQLPADHSQVRALVDIEPGSSSDESSSGRGSPMEIVDVDRFDTVSDRPRVRQGGLRVIGSPLPEPSPRNPALDAEIEAARGLPTDEQVSYYMSLVDRYDAVRERRQRESRPVVRERVPTYLDLPQEESRSPSPEPFPLTRASMPSTPVRPSTPPSMTIPLVASPSPPPSVTPRLYSWSTLSSAAPQAPARTARMSVAHIVPQRLSAYRVA